MSIILTTLIIGNISIKKIQAIEREFVRATESELPEKLTLDGKVWRRTSAVTAKTQFFAEIRFNYFRNIVVGYYAQWIPENADGSIGHFDLGIQSNYWLYEEDGDTGYQKGYGIWTDYSIPHKITENIDGTDGTGNDFFNNSFTAGDEYNNELKYTFRTGNSFLDDVEFYATKETIEAFLRSINDPSATFNVKDYVKKATLERRMKRPSDPKNPDSELADAPAGIHYGLYTDVLKLRPDIKSAEAKGSKQPPLSDSNWIVKEDKYGNKVYFYCTGKYGQQTFNYVAPSRTEIIGYKATYVSEGDTGGGSETDPIGGGEGTITFTPNQTPWTNKGKATGFPVDVTATGQVITHQWVQSYTLTETTNTWWTVEPDKDGKGGSSGSDTSTNSSNIDVPFEVKYTMSDITITGGATPATLPNTGGRILVPEGGYRNLSASATYTQQKGTPIPPPIPSPIKTGDGKNGSSTTYSLSVGGVKEVPKPNNPKGSAGTYNMDYTDPILELGAATNRWSQVILNVPINSYDPPGKYVPSGQSGINSSTYKVNDSSHYGRNAYGNFTGSKFIQLHDGIYSISLNNSDIAGNTSAKSDSTYYVDTTLPDCDFSVKVNQGVNNGTQRVFWGPGVGRYDDQLYGVLTCHDNLSGLIHISYAWTFGSSDSGASYKTIYTNPVTYYDRDNERPSFNIEKPVGDNMYMHVRMTDSAGNSAYYRFGAYEDPIKLKNFRVTDVRDPAWDKVFWSDANLTKHTGVTYNVSKLPIDDKNNTVYRNAYPKKGYAFYFDLTSEYLYRNADTIEIYPTFYYWDGKTRVPVDLYYNIDNNPFIKVGSNKDTHTFNMKVNGSAVNIGGLKRLTLHDKVRLHKGQAFNSWKGTIQYTNGKEQWWYGKYYIPATSIFTRQGQMPYPENLLKKNYIIVNFNIVAYKNGIETNSFIIDNQKFFYNISNPVFPEVTNQWSSEGGSKSPYLIGDTMIYDNSRSVLDDFDTIITQ